MYTHTSVSQITTNSIGSNAHHGMRMYHIFGIQFHSSLARQQPSPAILVPHIQMVVLPALAVLTGLVGTDPVSITGGPAVSSSFTVSSAIAVSSTTTGTISALASK
jgi:hypothetical protein